MNFHDLRIIVGQIKKTINCPKCQAKYKDADIELIGGLGDEHTFFFASCSKCEAESVINVSLQLDNPEASLPKLAKLGTAPRMGEVTANEVLDMHNFLKDFEGNFSDLFKTSKKTT